MIEFRNRVRARLRSRATEAGDTLVELLIALVVIGITATALLAGFSTSLSASAEHRHLATTDTALKGYVEAATYQIQLQQPPSATFAQFLQCTTMPTAAAYTSAIAATMSPATPSGFALPTGYTASITNVQFLSGTTWSPTCTAVQPPPPQMLTAQVSGNGGSESLDFVVSDPAYLPAPPAAPAIAGGSTASSTQTSTNSFTIPISAKGTPEPSLSTSTLPAGVTFVDNGGGSGTLTGTASITSPITPGTYTFTITASNGVLPTFTQTFTLNITAAPNISSASGVLFTEAVAGSFMVTSTGTPTPALTESGTLPSAVSFVDNGNGTATISGTPALGTAGNYPITITASNGIGSPFVQSFTFGVTAATKPVFTSANNTGFVAKVTSTFLVTTTGAPAATLTETGTLPSGVTFTSTPNSGTATIQGTPKANSKGTYPITISATNVVGTTTQAFTLTVS
jgi:Tfp pilus assembly protein PilV